MTGPLTGVWLSDVFDLAQEYGALLDGSDVLRMYAPEDVPDPAEVRFAVCWRPGEGAFTPYPNLGLAMTIAAGVDGLIDHPDLLPDVPVARIRDPHQAAMMAGYVAHEVLHHVRGFGTLERHARQGLWQRVPLSAPGATVIAVLGHGSMGRAVAAALTALGFTVRVACRSVPEAPLDGVEYLTGQDAIFRAADGAGILVNVLPLTAETENVLNAELFARLRPGAWLIQIGRGQHMDEAAFDAALDAGQLSGATLDVFRTEPLPPSHPYWQDERLRITPHIASDTLPEVVAEQVIETVTALRDGGPMRLATDRSRGY